jgi:diguanylate cyclase (GGDEF)-like protein
MESDSEAIEKPVPPKNNALEQVLGQNKDIKESVEKSASELASVNAALTQENTLALPVQPLEETLAQNQAIERNVARAANDLNQVNAELAKEVANRTRIESELVDTKIELSEARHELSQSQAKEAEALQIALYDSVTGLPNRLLFEQRLEHGLIQAKRYGWKLAVMFIDLDNFKRINDTHGHDLGDSVLIMVADRLQAFVRSEDTVSRWGGDEFVCLLLGFHQDTDIAHFAQQMVDRISEACELKGTVLSIGASIGVAIYPGDGETADTIFKNADQAMYAAKGTDKRVILFHESTLD